MSREPEEDPDDLAEVVRALESRLQKVEADARRLQGELDEMRMPDEVKFALQTMNGGMLS